MGIIRIFFKDSRQNKEFLGENAFFGYILSILGVFLEHIVSRDRGVIFFTPPGPTTNHLQWGDDKTCLFVSRPAYLHITTLSCLDH